METIKGFQGRFRFLSNFYPQDIDFEGGIYKSSEAAYQASKCRCEADKLLFITLDAREARTLGQTIPCREDWESEKLNVMYHILREKFKNQVLRRLLVDTGDSYLEETNYWHDKFWGVYNGVGENHLGRLLMVVRDEIKEGII